MVAKKFQDIMLTPLKPLIIHISVERLNIEIPTLITMEQWMSLIFAIGIYFKCILFLGTYTSANKHK